MRIVTIKAAATVVLIVLVLTPGVFGQNSSYGTSQRNEKVARYFRIAGLIVQIGCEIYRCNEPRQHYPERAGSAEYPEPGNYPSGTEGSETYGGVIPQDVTVFALAPAKPSVTGTRPSRTFATSDAPVVQNDQPTDGLRAHVQRAVQRIRQIGGTVRSVRFRRVGPWKWECDIVFRPRNGVSDSYCRVRSNGVIEGF
jgi:hypothetical protein